MHPRRTNAPLYHRTTHTPVPSSATRRRAAVQSYRPYIRTAAPPRNRTDHTFAPPRRLCSYADQTQTNRPHSLLHMSNCSYVQYITSPPLCQEENEIFYIKTLFQPPLARLTAPHTIAPPPHSPHPLSPPVPHPKPQLSDSESCGFAKENRRNRHTSLFLQKFHATYAILPSFQKGVRQWNV